MFPVISESLLAWDTLNDSTESEHKLIDSNERTMEQFWKALKVSKQSEKLEAGAENGCLESSDFCETTEEHAADLSELEGNMGLLDMNSQQLIASFLHQLQ